MITNSQIVIALVLALLPALLAAKLGKALYE
nr:photosystem I reaction center subunit M [Meringosphaera mediterranea]WLD05694.1 photosystem I reaction center subunit M [Meringosphaera mediterranea]WLD05896.1 photosystem I reaction center subunit M [Meringosphaera mediterranea]WLD06008.1 photosystem I reaction center subunit M [Meringosphaera mediterranea]